MAPNSGSWLSRMLLTFLVTNVFLIASISAAPNSLSHGYGLSRRANPFESNDWDTLYDAYQDYAEVHYAPQGIPENVIEAKRDGRKKFAWKDLNCVQRHLELEETIQSGSTGKVWKATLSAPDDDEIEDKTVAAKQSITDGESILVGAIVQQEIKNDHVVPVIDFFKYGDDLGILLMPQISGGDLKGKLSSYQKDGASAINKAFLQVLEGVQAVHAQDILHGDLKPGNVMVDDDTLMVTDFDTARKDTGEGLNWAIGTDSYVAPEIIRKQPYSKKVDVFSLGMILLDMTYEDMGGDENEKRLALWRKLIVGGGDSMWVKSDTVEDLLKENFEDMKDNMRKLLGKVLCEPDSRIKVDEYASQFKDLADL